jgi:hypothetical protein
MITTKEVKRIADKIISEHEEYVNDSHSRAEYIGVKRGLHELVTHLENAEKSKRKVIVWKDRTATYWDNGEIVTTELWELK